MAIETDQQKAVVIDQGTRHAFWSEWLLPEVQNRARTTLTALASKAGEDDDIKRGWFQALQWVINLPAQTLAIIQVAEDEANRLAADDAADAHASRYGHRSPLRAVRPGELKEQDDTRPTRVEGV